MPRSPLLPAFVAAVIAIAAATSAPAQTIVINPNRQGMQPPVPAAQPIRISLSVNMFVPAPGDDSAQAVKAQENGRKMIYESAAHECDVLLDTLARECRLESINISVQHVPASQNFNGAKVDGYNIGGNISFQIMPKDTAPKDVAPK